LTSSDTDLAIFRLVPQGTNHLLYKKGSAGREQMVLRGQIMWSNDPNCSAMDVRTERSANQPQSFCFDGEEPGGSTIHLGTMPKVGRLRVRLPDKDTVFFNRLNPSCHTAAMGMHSVPGNFLGVKSGRFVRMTTCLDVPEPYGHPRSLTGKVPPFGGVTSCGLLKHNRRFGDIYNFHHPVGKAFQYRNQCKTVK
jgi:hypothetical protein